MAYETCSCCAGSGKIERNANYAGIDGDPPGKQDCPYCGGSGSVENKDGSVENKDKEDDYSNNSSSIGVSSPGCIVALAFALPIVLLLVKCYEVLNLHL
jgi:DnaJ-class molecular chaperone